MRSATDNTTALDRDTRARPDQCIVLTSFIIKISLAARKLGVEASAVTWAADFAAEDVQSWTVLSTSSLATTDDEDSHCNKDRPAPSEIPWRASW